MEEKKTRKSTSKDQKNSSVKKQQDKTKEIKKTNKSESKKSSKTKKASETKKPTKTKKSPKTDSNISKVSTDKDKVLPWEDIVPPIVKWKILNYAIRFLIRQPNRP